MTSQAHQTHVSTRVGKIFVMDEGSGIPVVMWPSLFSDHALFDHVVELLGDRWRTIRVDGPGFGKSDPPLPDATVETYAGAVLDVLDVLGIDKAFVAGCSWGGQVALTVAARSPERVLGVLAMNTPLAPMMGGHAMEVFGTRLFGSTRFWGKGVARSMVAPTSVTRYPARVGAFIEGFRHFTNKDASRTVRSVMTRFPGLSEVLPGITVPTTILMGEEDRLYPVAKMRGYARLSPVARVVVVPNCGHLSPIEAPEAVCAELSQLQKNSR